MCCKLGDRFGSLVFARLIDDEHHLEIVASNESKYLQYTFESWNNSLRIGSRLPLRLSHHR